MSSPRTRHIRPPLILGVDLHRRVALPRRGQQDPHDEIRRCPALPSAPHARVGRGQSFTCQEEDGQVGTEEEALAGEGGVGGEAGKEAHEVVLGEVWEMALKNYIVSKPKTICT